MQNLKYNIATGQLQGRVGPVVVDTLAGAGGRAGSLTPGAENAFLSGNPLATHIGGERMKGTHTFGPLPVGRYGMTASAARPRWIVLTPLAGTFVHGRTGFAIHGRGPTGSHGCIVIPEKMLMERLHAAVLAHPPVLPLVLEVVAVGQDLDRQFRMV